MNLDCPRGTTLTKFRHAPTVCPPEGASRIAAAHSALGELRLAFALALAFFDFFLILSGTPRIRNASLTPTSNGQVSAPPLIRNPYRPPPKYGIVQQALVSNLPSLLILGKISIGRGFLPGRETAQAFFTGFLKAEIFNHPVGFFLSFAGRHAFFEPTAEKPRSLSIWCGDRAPCARRNSSISSSVRFG
jgi:hypothetical protein